MKRLALVLVGILAACSTLSYVDDSDFLVSAQADSPEFPVYINGKICKDTDGIPGLCSKRIRSNEALTLHMDARPYSYVLQLACTKELGESQSFSIQKDMPFEHSIKPENFSRVKSFICIGEVLPDDREMPISAKWEIRAKIVDQAYVRRETPYFKTDKGKTFLIMGQHAKFSSVFDQGAWKAFKEKTVIEIKGKPENVIGYSESFNARFNSIGF